VEFLDLVCSSQHSSIYYSRSSRKDRQMRDMHMVFLKNYFCLRRMCMCILTHAPTLIVHLIQVKAGRFDFCNFFAMTYAPKHIYTQTNLCSWAIHKYYQEPLNPMWRCSFSNTCPQSTLSTPHQGIHALRCIHDRVYGWFCKKADRCTVELCPYLRFPSWIYNGKPAHLVSIHCIATAQLSSMHISRILS
jgi:hypothetical protein